MSRAHDPTTALERSIADAFHRADIAAELQRRLASVHGVGYDEDRLVCAVVSGAGALVDLTFHPAAPGLGPTRLGEAIVAAANHAQTDARQRGYTMMALALGDEATAAVEAVDSPAPARALGWDTVGRAADRAPAPGMTGAGSFVPEPGGLGPFTPASAVPEVAATGAAEPRLVVPTLGADSPDDDDLSTFDASIFRSDR